MSHTKGPWAIEIEPQKRYDEKTGELQIREWVLVREPVNQKMIVCFTSSASLPDAYLIAAAPEMLEALEKIVCAKNFEIEKALENARQIIKKAKGEL